MMRSRFACRSRQWVMLGLCGLWLGGCATHRPPMSEAGDDASVAENTLVTLHGLGADPDGGQVTFIWRQISGPQVTLSNPQAATPSFTTPSTPGRLTFELTVTDHENMWTTSEVTITVQNKLPTVYAGADQTFQSGTSISLFGTGSDPEGGTVTFHWSQVGGSPTVALTNADTPNVSFTAPFVGATLTLRLTVTDTEQGTASDDVIITISPLNAGHSKLFVANSSDNSVVRFDDPAGLSGDIAPSHTVSGVNTLLNTPSDVVVEYGGTLLVTNANPASFSVTGYSNATTANGNIIPNQVVQGSNTGLTAEPGAMALEFLSNSLFVARLGISPAILVFNSVAGGTFTGNKAPDHVFTTTGKLTSPFGMCFDGAGNLYVADNATSSVLVYQNPTTLDGEQPVFHTITGNPNFSGLYDVFVDSGDRLYVVSSLGPPRVDIFTGASSLNGLKTPTSTLVVLGAADLTSIAVDSSAHGYLLDHAGAKIYTYDGIPGLDGSLAPTQTIAGGNTKLAGAIRLFLLEE